MRPVGLGLEVGTVSTTLSDKDSTACTKPTDDDNEADDAYRCKPTPGIRISAAELDEAAPSLSPGRSPEPRPGSSCYALRAAVGLLAMWDDFDAVKIGEGFFADVFKIRHKSDGRVMVVKVGKQKRFRANHHKMIQELELLNKFQHPNVVRYMGACVKDGHIHPVLEYVSGGSLFDIVTDDSIPLSWRQKGELALDIARGMTYLHSKNVCHRDLTSGNCLVRRKPNNIFQAVVTDFGLARVLGCMPDAPPNSPRTPDAPEIDPIDKPDCAPGRFRRVTTCMDVPRKMSLVGSAFWMAPEIFRGEEYTRQVDVFSYGIVLCEIVARTTANPDDLPRTGKFGLDMEMFRERCPGIPEPFLEIAEDCCSMDPTERPVFLELVRRLTIICGRMENEDSETTSTSNTYNISLTDIIRTHDDDKDAEDVFHFKSNLPWMNGMERDDRGNGDGDDDENDDEDDNGDHGDEVINGTRTLHNKSTESRSSEQRRGSAVTFCAMCMMPVILLWSRFELRTAFLGTSLICACVALACENSVKRAQLVAAMVDIPTNLFRNFSRVASTSWAAVSPLFQAVQYRRLPSAPGSDVNENVTFTNQNGSASKSVADLHNRLGDDKEKTKNGGVRTSILKNSSGGSVVGSEGHEVNSERRGSGRDADLQMQENSKLTKMLNGRLGKKRVSFSVQSFPDQNGDVV